MAELLLAYTFTIIISAIVGLGNISSEEPGDGLTAVSDPSVVEDSQSNVKSLIAKEMDREDPKLVGASQEGLNRGSSDKSLKEEVSSMVPRSGRIHDVFQEEGATHDESDFETWAK
ncbi:MAG: hypothetical protein VX884_01250 [Pseudomonadota bacterium]|nr:hypothetical protein [Pseudomonadota bacterium]